MSTVGSFDKTAHLGELNSPLFGVNPVPVTPAARKAATRANLGVSSTAESAAATAAAMQTFAESGVLNARFGEQPLYTQPTPVAVNATATMTAANLLAGIITSTSAAIVAATLPLATDFNTALLAAYPTLANGDSIDVYVINTGPSAFNVTTNTGWTLVGGISVATATSRQFRVVRTSATAYVLYGL